MKKTNEVPATEQTSKPEFKELNLKQAKTLETKVKAIKGVADVELTTNKKKIKVLITAKVKEDQSIYQSAAAIAIACNFKVGRSYFIDEVLTVNLVQA
jgi:copper chaperone CopZ